MTKAPQFEAEESDPLFPVTFRALSEGIYGHGVIAFNGLEPVSGTGDFEVDVGAGEVQYDGNRLEHATTSTLTVPAPEADPRWDLVYFDTSTGDVVHRQGVASVTPMPPGLQAGELLVAYIEVLPEATSIENDDIRDWRARPQPAMNVPLDHADYGNSNTVYEALGSLHGHGNERHSETFAVDGDSQPPEVHDNSKHSTNYSAQGHDHSGETLGETEALARINALEAQIGTLMAALDVNGNDLNNVGSIGANSASVSSAPSSDTDVVRKTELDAVDAQTEIETREVAERSNLPDPTTLDSSLIAYIEDEDIYVGAHQS